MTSSRANLRSEAAATATTRLASPPARPTSGEGPSPVQPMAVVPKSKTRDPVRHGRLSQRPESRGEDRMSVHQSRAASPRVEREPNVFSILPLHIVTRPGCPTIGEPLGNDGIPTMPLIAEIQYESAETTSPPLR